MPGTSPISASSARRSRASSMSCGSRSMPGKEGIYRGQCAALCGRDHGFMPVVVDVRTPADFKKWVEEQKAALKQAAAPARPTLRRPAQALNEARRSRDTLNCTPTHRSRSCARDPHDDHHDQPADGHQALAVRDQSQRHRHDVSGVQPDHVLRRRRDGDGDPRRAVPAGPAARRS